MQLKSVFLLTSIYLNEFLYRCFYTYFSEINGLLQSFFQIRSPKSCLYHVTVELVTRFLWRFSESHTVFFYSRAIATKGCGVESSNGFFYIFTGNFRVVNVSFMLNDTVPISVASVMSSVVSLSKLFKRCGSSCCTLCSVTKCVKLGM